MASQVAHAVSPAAKAVGSAVAPAAKSVGAAVAPTVTAVSAAAAPAARAISDSAAQAAQRMQRYLAEQDTLKAFHDAGAHGESALLALLRRVGTQSPPASRSRPADGVGRAVGPTSPSWPQASTGSATGAEGWRWPVDAGIVSSEYGARWGRQHHGIDIAARVGEPIYASGDGEVIYSGNGMSGYGNVIVLRHAGGLSTLYAHNSELKVTLGTQVRSGDLIALLGNTGRSTGPHVHFEMRRGEISVDPRSILPTSQLAEIAPRPRSGRFNRSTAVPEPAHLEFASLGRDADSLAGFVLQPPAQLQFSEPLTGLTEHAACLPGRRRRPAATRFGA